MSSINVRQAVTQEDIALAEEVRKAAWSEFSTDKPDKFDPHSRHYIAEQGGQGVAYARMIEGPELLSAEAFYKLGWLLPGLSLWEEPSRFCIHPAFRKTADGRKALLGIAGATVCDALAKGHLYFLSTLRLQFVKTFPWFPYVFGPPISYPASAGGPDLDEPILTATIYLPDVVPSMQVVKPEFIPYMFPEGAPVTDLPRSLSDEELADLYERNNSFVSGLVRDMKSDSLKLTVVPSLH